MRTVLTMLGVVIGVASVITMLGMVTGATKDMQDRIATLGSNVMMVWAEGPRGGVSQGHTQPVHLTLADARAIAQECPAVRAVSGVDRTRAQCVYQNTNWQTSIIGVGVDHPRVCNMQMAGGTWFSEGDVEGATRVCVLGSTVAKELFGNVDPVGAVMRVYGFPFQVLGVLASKGANGMGDDQDDSVYAPVTIVMRSIDHQRWLDYAIVSARDGDHVQTSIKQITALLRQRHHTRDDAPDDFSLHTQTEIAQRVSSQSQVMTLFLGGVAAISLLVGGIGIMNIMLVSVTERLREIGIRLAIGARSWDILLQFLAESMTLSCASGLAGILLGVVCARVAASLSGWPFYVSTQSIVLAFAFSVFVGVFFGLYPAIKASRLDPIEALRTE